MGKFICQQGELNFSGTEIDGSNNPSIGGWCLNNVVMDINTEVLSYVCMGDSLWDSGGASLKSATFTFEIALDSVNGGDVDGMIGTSGVLNFETIDGLIYSATVYIINATVNTPVDDIATVTFEAEVDGEITENTS